MNKVMLVGRLTRDLELRKTTTNRDYLMFNVAISRRYTNKNGEREADFINCIAWERTAQNIATYFQKGSLIGIEGRVTTRSYNDASGKRVFVTEILVEEFEFIEPRRKNGSNDSSTQSNDSISNTTSNDAFFSDITSSNDNNETNDILNDLDISDDELPF